MMNERHRIRLHDLLLIFISGYILVLIGFHVYNSYFSRYMCDEFVIAYFWQEKSFPDFFGYWYTSFTGRFSLIGMYALLGAAPSRIVTILPGLTIAAWIGILALFFQRSLKLLVDVSLWLMAFFMSILVVGFTLAVSPNVFQSLYWSPGHFTYTWPLVLMCVSGVLFIRFYHKKSQNHWWWGILIFLLSLVTAGFNESLALAAAGFFALFYAALRFFKLARSGFPFLMAFLGCTSALIIHVAAPGNWQRMTLFNKNPDFFDAGRKALFFLLTDLRDTVIFHWLLLLVIFTAFFWAAAFMPAANDKTRLLFRRCLLVMPVLMLSVHYLLLFPSFYASGTPPVDRLQIMRVFNLIIFCAASGFMVSHVFFPGRFPALTKSIGMIFLSVVVVIGFWSLFRDAGIIGGRMKRYAHDWDIREKIILDAKAKGESAVIIPRLRTFNLQAGLEEASTDPDFWVNRFIGRYYGVVSVRCPKRLEKRSKEHKKRRRPGAP